MKKFKTKSKKKKKTLLLIILSLIFIVLFIYISNQKLDISYGKYINFLLRENHFEIKNNNSSFFSFWTNNLDVLLSNYYFKNEKTVKNIVYEEIKPVVYIYNTHDQEKYNNENEFLGFNSIYDVSLLLKKELNKYKIESIVEDKKVSNYLEKENLKYSDSYKISRRFLEESILKYPTLNYFIDLHRDSVSKEHTNITIDNKEYAKIMFVLGLENKNYKANKELMIKLNNYLDENYKGLSRGIYEKKGSGVNGVYNQDFHENTILIEIGGVDNNLESIVNSTEIIAKGLYYIIGDKNEEIN